MTDKRTADIMKLENSIQEINKEFTDKRAHGMTPQRLVEIEVLFLKKEDSETYNLAKELIDQIHFLENDIKLYKSITVLS